jgi:hypothetical protein
MPFMVGFYARAAKELVMCTPSVCAYLVHGKLTVSFTIATDVQKPRAFVFHHAQIINVKTGIKCSVRDFARAV